MTLTVAAEPVPLIEDADGVMRVGGIRVTLDSVIIAYENGATAIVHIVRHSRIARWLLVR